ncbi:MAG: phosphotransferase [Rikenellaceae bacterium]
MFALNSEIVDGARSADFASRLRSLSNIELMCDAHGEPIYFTGNSAVIVRIKENGIEKSMRCYKVENPHLKAIYGDRYFAKEFNVARHGAEKLIDVVICDWVDGVSLDTAIREATEERGRSAGRKNDYRDSGNHTLRKLSIAFDTMARNTLREEWAHGDISLDNIIVKSDGTMQLIDFDTAYVPALKGRKSISCGTPQFQSPLRTLDHFNENIDHFSLMIISLSLRALSEDMWLYKRYPSKDNLLLEGEKVSNRDCEIMRSVMALMAENGLFAHYRVAKLLYLRQIEVKHLYMIFDFALQERLRERFMNESQIATAEALRERYAQRDIKLFEPFVDDINAYGFYDPTRNEILIPALFDEVLDFEANEHAEVKVGRNSFLIDKRGTIVDTLKNDEEREWSDI